MTDVLIDGRVIPVPPGWTIRLVLERTTDDQHPTTTRGGDTAYSHRGVTQEPHSAGARRPGTEHEPTVDELHPLPVMRPRNGNGKPAPDAKEHPSGKPCEGCGYRCGPRSRACPSCGLHFPEKAAR